MAADMKTLQDFSPVERETINGIYAKDFENLTKDEALLYAEWVKVKALVDEEMNLKREALQQKTEAAIELNRQESAKSLEALEAMAEQAKAKLRLLEAQEKAVNDGQA